MAELITGYGVEQEEHSEHQTETYNQYLTFQADREVFAVDILDIKEIIEVSQMTPVPMMPNFIRGVINLRGRVVPVIDLAARMRREPSRIGKRSCIVLVDIGLKAGNKGQVVGMLVDKVNEIVEIEQNHIQPSPDMGDGIDTRFIKAMGRIDESFFILLDIENILSHEEIGQLEQLKQRHPASMTAPTMEQSDSE